MSDIIDIIDGLHAEATKGPLRRSEASGVIESSDGVFVASGTWPHDGNMLVALVNNWPSISARLREAERKYDELFVLHHLGSNVVIHDDGTFEGHVRNAHTRVAGKTPHELRVAIEAAIAAKETEQ